MIKNFVNLIVTITVIVIMGRVIVMIPITVNYAIKLPAHFSVISMVDVYKENAFVMKDTMENFATKNTY